MKPTPLRRLSPSRRLMREYRHGLWLTEALQATARAIVGLGAVVVLALMLGASITGN